MRRFLTALLVALAVVASACSVPDRGDIHTTTLEHRGSDEDVIPYSPAGPAPGASPSEIVNGFIEAMKAAPINTAYAKRFLTDDAASAWDPSKRTIVYSELVDHGGSSQVMLTAKQGDWLDGRGVWHGRIPVDGTPLPFRLTKVAGEWRISSAPDALVVESAWFESHFARSLLYYFDPSGRFLVPEPVFVPRGAQYASALVSSLLTGPGTAERGAVRSYLPPKASEVLSVPVRNGMAEIDLRNVGEQSTQAIHLMTAQLAWTLRQDDSIERVRLTLDGDPVALPDSGSTFNVRTTGPGYDPNGFQSGADLYGLRSGVVVSRHADGTFATVEGPWAERHDVTDLSVGPSGKLAAAVSPDRRSVLTGSLGGAGDVTALPVSGTHFLRGSWDLNDRLWLVDATHHGARVMYATGGRVHPVEVPGVSGEDVLRLLVSRDGTRLVALIQGPATDRIVVSRLRSSAAGEVASTGPAAPLAFPASTNASPSTRIADIAWTSPTTIVAAQQFARTAILQPLSVDGATLGVSSETPTVSDKVSGLVGSPVTSARLYVRSGDHLIDPTDSSALALEPGVTDITYQG